jgi:hypothetical protein
MGGRASLNSKNIAVVLMSLHLYGNQQGWLRALGFCSQALEAVLRNCLELALLPSGLSACGLEGLLLAPGMGR